MNIEIFKKYRYLSKEIPIQEIWDLLSITCTKSNAENYNIKHRTIKDIKFYLQQSYELFKSSNKVSNITSPLLQFYSFSNLAKMLIIMRQTKNNIENLDHAHGFKMIITNGAKDGIDDIKIKINKEGTFIEILNSLYRKDKIDAYIDEVFSLRELLDLNIDMYDFINNNTNVFPVNGFNIYELRQNEIGNKNKRKYTLEIRFINKNSFKFFQKTFLKDDSSSIERKMYSTSLDPSGYPARYYFDDESELPPLLFERNYADEYFIVSPIKKNDKQLFLYQIEILYLISFIYSNLVRYYPKVWDNLKCNEEVFWEIEKSITYMNRSFPNYILNFIEKCYTVILIPGILKRS